MNRFTHATTPAGTAVYPRASAVRPVGAEFRMLGWLARHPLFVLLPAALGAALYGFGPLPVGYTAAALTGVGVLWWRGLPRSFDRHIRPRLRTIWRRWTAYQGRRWRAAVAACELVRTNHRTGHTVTPALSRVRAVTPSIDTLRVRMVPGQDLTYWTERLPALADALGAHRVAVTRRGPGSLAVVVERRMPFTYLIDPTPIPGSVLDVDPDRVVVGEDEYGQDFTIALRGKHLLGVGASGAGKSSLLWNPLRGLGPLIRDGLVRVWVLDLKSGAETDRGRPLFHRHAATLPEAIGVLTEFRDSLRARLAHLRATGTRINTITADTPWELLIVDELAMLTAYGDRTHVRQALSLLAEVLTQGRAADHTVLGYVQEPTKDVVDVRELFTTRLCLGVTAASHVDMALGEGARDRGALADEIPADLDHAGIGFAVAPRTRIPVRFRAGLVEDGDIDELVRRCTPNPTRTTDLDRVGGGDNPDGWAA